MAHPVFDIPEIVRLICEVVDKSCLVNLLTVSRGFFELAVPLVWKNINQYKLDHFLTRLDSDYSYGLRTKTAENLHFGRFLDRWGVYALHIARYSCEFSDRLFDWEWDVLPNTACQSLLPNLQVLEFFVPNNDFLSPTDFAEKLGKHLGRTVTSVYHRIDNAPTHLNTACALELTKIIVQSCPNLHTLQFFPYDYVVQELGTDFIGQLRQLDKLRTLGLGSIVWEPGVFSGIGSLPNLESLTIMERGTISRAWQSSLKAVESIPGKFPALRHLGITLHILAQEFAIVPQLWRIPALVQQLTSVSLGILLPHVPMDPLSDGMWSSILSICKASPNLADLYIHCMVFMFDPSSARLQLFPPRVCAALQQLPLRHLTFTTRNFEFSLDDFDLERFVLALPNVEFLLLDIRKHRLTFENLKLVARHMKKLQHLVVALHPLDWPVEMDSVSNLSPSPSTLYLDATARALYLGDEETERVAKCLHRLWPSGVHCVTKCATKKYEDVWVRLNKALARLRASEGLGGVIVMSGHSGKYINEDTTPLLRQRLREMKRFPPPSDGFDFPYKDRVD